MRRSTDGHLRTVSRRSLRSRPPRPDRGTISTPGRSLRCPDASRRGYGASERQTPSGHWVGKREASESRGQRGGSSGDGTERCVVSLVLQVFRIRCVLPCLEQELVSRKRGDDEQDAHEDEDPAQCRVPSNNFGSPRNGEGCQEDQSRKRDEPPANLLAFGLSHLTSPPRALSHRRSAEGHVPVVLEA